MPDSIWRIQCRTATIRFRFKYARKNSRGLTVWRPMVCLARSLEAEVHQTLEGYSLVSSHDPPAACPRGDRLPWPALPARREAEPAAVVMTVVGALPLQRLAGGSCG